MDLSGTHQAANQLAISTTKQPIQSVTSSTPNSPTFPEETFVKIKHNVNDIQSDVLVAKKGKLKLEMEYIKLKMKKVSSEIEIVELKKKSLTANDPFLSHSAQPWHF